MLVLVYRSQDVNAERFNARKYYLPNSIMRIFNIIINLKNVYDQPIDSHIKRNKEIRKLTTRQGKIILLGVYYIKNNCRLTAVDLSRQKKLDADPKAIQQI